jgi:hypothetical protein
MSEIDFLVSIRRILLSAVALMDKRIEQLRNVPAEVIDQQQKEMIERIADRIRDEK